MDMSRRRLVRRAAVAVLAVAVTTVGGWGGSGGGPAAAAPMPLRAAAHTASSASSSPSPSVWPRPARAALPAPTARQLQAAVDEYVRSTGIVGVTAALVTPEGSWTGAAGVDGVGVRLRAASAMPIASTTKTFVAAEILVLARRGRIDLDAPVTRYVALPFDAHGATVRQLATMTSGFPFIPNETAIAAASADLDRRWTCRDTVSLVPRDAPRLGEQGGAAAYNGLNYVVLAMVVEKVTRLPLAEALRRDLVAPAGLHRTWTETGARPERPRPPRALPVDDPVTPVVDRTSPLLPSTAAATSFCGGAGVVSDALDLARWGYLLYGGRLIDRSLVDVMTTPNPLGGDWGYGFGTMIADWDGTPFWGHAGNYVGYTSILFAWPQTHTTAVVLTPVSGGPDNDVRADLAIGLYLTLLGG